MATVDGSRHSTLCSFHEHHHEASMVQQCHCSLASIGHTAFPGLQRAETYIREVLATAFCQLHIALAVNAKKQLFPSHGLYTISICKTVTSNI
jgi:hypothetical protein